MWMCRMDEIDELDMMKYGEAHPMSRDESIKLLTKIFSGLIERDLIKGDAKTLATKIVDSRKEIKPVDTNPYRN